MQLKLAPWNCFKPSSKIFYWPFEGGASFVDHLSYLCLVFVMLRICSLLPCGHLLGKGWPLGSCLWRLIVFCQFPMWYPRSGVVLDNIDSWNLLPFLLSLLPLTTSVVQKLCIPIIASISVFCSWNLQWLVEDWKELGFFCKIDFNQLIRV